MPSTGADTLCYDKLLCLAQAVIFIFEHSEQGSAGLILNRPTQYTIGSMPGLETLCPDFANNVLFLVSASETLQPMQANNKHDAGWPDGSLGLTLLLGRQHAS